MLRKTDNRKTKLENRNSKIAHCGHSRASGNPYPLWTPAFAGVTPRNDFRISILTPDF
jgi:hypothetical protein